MSSAYDGRAISAIRQGAPIKFEWDGAYFAYTYHTVLKGGPNTTNAQKLLAFLSRAQISAGFTLGTGFPAPNVNQLKYLPADFSPLLAINPENAAKLVLEDSIWSAAKSSDGKSNRDYIQERWMNWRTS